MLRVVLGLLLACAFVGCGREVSEADLLREMATREIAEGLKYKAYSEVAEAEGYDDVASLFDAVHHGEMYQCGAIIRCLRAMGEEFAPRIDSVAGVGSTLENLYSAKNSEEYSVDVLYPEMLEEFKGNDSIIMCIESIQRSDISHRALFVSAIEALETHKSDTTININRKNNWCICTKCGTVSAEAKNFVRSCSNCLGVRP